MKQLPLFFLPLLLCCGNRNEVSGQAIVNQGIDTLLSFYTRDSILHAKANEALTYCNGHNMNTDFCLLLDYKLHSGFNRFFVYDFNQAKITDSSLVSHGCGKLPWNGDFSKASPVFSNADGSHCSSLGMYRIGARAYSDWGIHVKYILKGLSETNSNAEARLIVLHSWDAVSDSTCYPQGTAEGWGCPAVSNTFMKRLDTKLQSTSRPVLLYAYY